MEHWDNEMVWRCPTCGRFISPDTDGFFDVAPGGMRGSDPVVAYCNERCCDRKDPPVNPEGER